MEQSRDINYLLRRYMDNLSSVNERQDFLEYIQQYPDDAELIPLLQRLGLEQLPDPAYDPQRWAHIIHNILAKDTISTTPVPSSQTKKMFRSKSLRWASAAAILIIFGMGTYLNYSVQVKQDMVHTKPSPGLKDVLPGSDKAILTLSGGQKIQLSKMAAEMIQDGSIPIKNSNGQLSYKSAETVGINTMTTPKGGQYQLILEDGTKVWLNAASSITYPTAFTSKTREVSVSGEAYFEISRNKHKPFIVKVNDQTSVRVLGTHFNVNSYADEKEIKVSLLEGSVEINKVFLKPGQAYSNGKVMGTNVEQDVAWKNGAFNFTGLKFPEAMRQLARWYDIDVHMEYNTKEIELSGEIGRQLTLQELLAGLEMMNVHFQLKGKDLYITQ